VLHDLHLGDGLRRALEILEARPPLGRELDAQKDGDAEAQRRAVGDDPAPGDDARLLEPSDPPPGGRLRQAERPPDRARPLPRILGHGAQDGAVGRVDLDHSGNAPSSRMVATSISASVSAMCGSRRMRSR